MAIFLDNTEEPSSTAPVQAKFGGQFSISERRTTISGTFNQEWPSAFSPSFMQRVIYGHRYSPISGTIYRGASSLPSMFARYLKVTTGLVSQWERGEKHPAGASLKLLTLVARNGLAGIA